MTQERKTLGIKSGEWGLGKERATQSCTYMKNLYGGSQVFLLLKNMREREYV